MSERIEREVVLPSPREHVWEIVTGSGWLAEEVELELVPGGEARFRCGDEVKVGWVEEARPPGRLAFWWSSDGEAATRVELTLSPERDDGTRLRVVETRPLDVLDLVGIPLHSAGRTSYGPALLAA